MVLSILFSPAVQSILVRATVTASTEESFLRKVMMDIAVAQVTGGPLVAGAEECRCPPGYSGYSCETCALGYYRDTRDRSRGEAGSCVRCPCSNSEDSCLLLPTGQVQCVCRDGWSGSSCQHRGE
jgi:laminin alpha 3/5